MSRILRKKAALFQDNPFPFVISNLFDNQFSNISVLLGIDLQDVHSRF